jgi:CO dehydrogenase/acetyl-CoA synthase gamma subunit (corrinoid Fe-S protein)
VGHNPPTGGKEVERVKDILIDLFLGMQTIHKYQIIPGRGSPTPEHLEEIIGSHLIVNTVDSWIHPILNRDLNQVKIPT